MDIKNLLIGIFFALLTVSALIALWGGIHEWYIYISLFLNPLIAIAYLRRAKKRG